MRQTIAVLDKSVWQVMFKDARSKLWSMWSAWNKSLPVIKQIPQGADLTTVDKAVQLVFTDGTTAHYEVDQWTLEAGQEDQLSTPGARLKATGLLGNGETVQATLVVAGGDVGKAKKPTVQLDG